MTVQVNKNEMEHIRPLFDGWEETLIWSCLEGYMGQAFTDSIVEPASAQIITGDFCFFAGRPNKELAENCNAEFILMVPGSKEWGNLIEEIYREKAKKVERYAIKKEPDIFDRALLAGYIKKLPMEYRLEFIDEYRYEQILEEDWSRDLCAQFKPYEQYRRLGLGVAALLGERIVSGASSYGVYDKGIEIEVDTKKEYRRKGLALACASRLILTCLERNLYPSWDAQNMGSVHLAEKLGYHFDKAYVTYEVTK